MARTVPTSEPARLVAGDTWNWKKSLAEYPPSESWVVSYGVAGPSVLATADITVVSDSSDYEVTVAAAKTAVLLPGTYRWEVYATKAGARYTVDQGTFIVEPNLAAGQTAGSAQPACEKRLAIVEAALSGRLTADMQEYTIAGRSITKIPVLELEKLRSKYAAQVWRYRNGNKLGPNHEATFARAR